MRDLEEIWAEAFRERYNEGPKRVAMLFGEKVREECALEFQRCAEEAEAAGWEIVAKMRQV